MSAGNTRSTTERSAAEAKTIRGAAAGLRAAMVGIEITPRFHPTCGAWGTTPSITEVDMPLMSRCLVLEQAGRMLVWFGSDLVGDPPRQTDLIRKEIADALQLRTEQVVWSTSQTHSSGALPGSSISGSCITDLSRNDREFMEAERSRLMRSCIDAAREAISRLAPARLHAGRGYCDSVSYNTRFPMPKGGVKFSRHHEEGLQSGKYFDPTIGLLRFEEEGGKTIGVIFNFCAHPATMITGRMISPDYVGTTRRLIEEAIGGAPAMFCQGFCGDVNIYHIFGTPENARETGAALGRAAVEALGTLIPAHGAPFDFAHRTISIDCQPMPQKEQFEREIELREKFFEDVKRDPLLTWCDGINLPEYFPPESRAKVLEIQLDYLKAGLRMLASGEKPRERLPLTLAAVRIGDAAAVLSPGENFTLTGNAIRARSPFVHTLVCGDTNGLFGYIGTDEEIDRGGYETRSYWMMDYIDGFRLPPARGSAERIVSTARGLLADLRARS